MKLYDFASSHNCYKVRLFLGILGLEYERRPVDLVARENRTPEFLRMNPRGQVPVLEDEGLYLWESTAILVYLARKHQAKVWLPDDPVILAMIAQWLAVAQNELLYGVGRAHWLKRGGTGDLSEATRRGRRGMAVLDSRLAERAWLVGHHPTIADIACYPHAALATEAGIPVTEYSNVVSWCRNIENIPGYVAVTEISSSGEASQRLSKIDC